MKKLLFPIFLFILFVPLYLKAQVNHFIYLQTETKHPFYAKLNKKLMGSSASGYLIIPKLKGGAYNLAIGFMQGDNEEQNYNCTIGNKDVGYLIKNFGDKGWGLFNLQTLEVIMSDTNPDKLKDVSKAGKADDFSSMLSEVVNDPSIKRSGNKNNELKPIVSKKEDKPGLPTEVKTDSVSNKENVKPNKFEPEEPLFKKGITKIKVTTDIDGVETIYVDVSNGLPDTIKIFIPTENNSEVDGNNNTKTDKLVTPKKRNKQNGNIQEDIQKTESTQQTDTNTTAIINSVINETKLDSKINNDSVLEKKSDDTKLLPKQLSGKNEKADEKIKNKDDDSLLTNKSATLLSDQKFSPIAMINSDCKSNATDDDFLKLRKKMASVEEEEKMITIAKKFFKTKCFTTDQIKNLSSLFLKDAGKYNFFDVAYQYVSDSHNFSTLETQLSDPYFISRFKALIRN